MRGSRAVSIAFALAVAWPVASGAPTAPPTTEPRAERVCAPADPRVIGLRCETPALRLSVVSVLDPLPSAPPLARPPAPLAERETAMLRAPAAAVPEPTPLALLLAGVTALALRRPAR